MRDDYGLAADEIWPRRTAQAVLDYVRGRSDARWHYADRRYGAAAEVLLWRAARAEPAGQPRHLSLAPLLTPLLFLAGGLGAAALAFRLYGRLPRPEST